MCLKDVGCGWVPLLGSRSPRFPSWGSGSLAFRAVRLAFFSLCLRLCRVGWFVVSSFVSFVPAVSAVSLGGFPASSVVPVSGPLGSAGGVVVGSSWVSGSARGGWVAASASSARGLAVWFRGSSVPLVCLRAALAPACFSSLVASVASAGASGAVVFPVVASGSSGGVAPGFLCGLASSGPVAAAPVVGCVVL